MKIILLEIDYVFDCGQEKTCCVVVENQRLLYKILEDLSGQMAGEAGIAVLSEDNKTLNIAKYCEVISQFAPFDINRKNLLTKIGARMHQLAVSDVHYLKMQELMTEWERYLMELSMEMVGNLEFPKISPDSLIKAAGVQLENTYDNLGEQLLDYFELVQEYEAKKLFVLVNLRSYLSDEEMHLFLEGIQARQIELLLLESTERRKLEPEQRYIVDQDLCVIC